MSPVDFKKWPCRPVEFKGQGPSRWPRCVKYPDGYPNGISLFYLPFPTFYDAKICQNMSKQLTVLAGETMAVTTAALSCPIQNESGEFVCT